MMNFNKQDREWIVTLSEAKGLSRWAERCFASLSMTIPVLVIKVHNRAATTVLILFCLPEWMVDDKGNRYYNYDNSHRAYQEIDIFTTQ